MPGNSDNNNDIKPKGRKLIFLLQLLQSAFDGVFLVGSAAIVLGVVLTLFGVTVAASPLLFLGAVAGIFAFGASALYIRRLREKDRQTQLAIALNEQKTASNALYAELEKNDNQESKKNLIENLAKKLSSYQNNNQKYLSKKRVGAQIRKTDEAKKSLIEGHLNRYVNQVGERNDLKRRLHNNLENTMTGTKKDIFTNKPSQYFEKTSLIVATGITEGRSIFTGVRDSVQVAGTISVIMIGLGVTFGFMLGGPVGGAALILGFLMGVSIFKTMRNEKKQNLKLGQVKDETAILKDELKNYKIAELERNYESKLNITNTNYTNQLNALSEELGKQKKRADDLDDRIHPMDHTNLHLDLELQRTQLELKRAQIAIKERDAKLEEKDDKIARQKTKISQYKAKDEGQENRENQKNAANKPMLPEKNQREPVKNKTSSVNAANKAMLLKKSQREPVKKETSVMTHSTFFSKKASHSLETNPRKPTSSSSSTSPFL